MSQSQADEAFLSVRIVVLDHYQGEPVSGLDPLYSDRGYEVRRVPVLRVFGSTPAGQKTTLHIHGIFPYLYVPWPEKEKEGFTYRLASALDKAINTSLNQSKADIQHVYKAVKVSGRPFYGYHPRQHTFVKIYFYSYSMLKRGSDLLNAGVILGEVFQPHESHVPPELQFMMDYNLQGMNLIHLKHVMFRQGALHDEYDDIEPFFDVKRRNPGDNFNETFTSPHTKFQREPAESRYFYPDTVPDILKLPTSLARISNSELEVDTVAMDILNTNDLGANTMNPGLKALWDDERIRRNILNIDDPLTPPGSPPRPPSAYLSSDSEKFWMERFDTMLEEKTRREEGDDFLEEDSSDPDATINIHKLFKGSQGSSVYAGETSDSDLSILPGATQLEHHVPTLSMSILNQSQSFIGTPTRSSQLSQTVYSELDESQCYLDETLQDEEDSNESDDELVDLLANLVANPPASQQSSHSSSQSSAQTEEKVLSSQELFDENMFASPQEEEKKETTEHPLSPNQSDLSFQGSIIPGSPTSPIIINRAKRSSQKNALSQTIASSQDMALSQHSVLSQHRISSQPNVSSQPSVLSQPNVTSRETLFPQSLDISDREDLIEDFDDDELNESLVMSQAVWDSDPFSESVQGLDSSLWGDDDGEDEILRTLDDTCDK